jgi:RHS repeat-associated protein
VTDLCCRYFDYDRFGNRYLKAADNPTSQNPLMPTPIEANSIDKSKNQLASNTGTIYDDAGNVTTDNKFRSLKYSYDANGRMYKTSSVDDLNQSNSVYDASGQRVAQQINGVWKFFVYDAAGKMVAEYGGTPLTDEGGVKYVHQDAQGSTRAITSASGAVKARSDYAAFGEEINASIGQRTAQGYTSSDSLRQKYAQTERDEASGLDHTWFRKNENRAGRWTSPDPYNGSMNLGDPQSFNRYSYVENQPTNFVDPSGLNAVSFFCYDIVTTGHYTNDPSHVYTHTETVCSSFGGGGSSGGGIGGEFGGGGSVSVDNSRKKEDDDFNGCKGVAGFTESIANYSAQQLNDAVTTVFGEISSRIHEYIYGEAVAVASVIFNRSDAVKNGTQGNNPFGKSSSLSDVVGAGNGKQFLGFAKGNSVLQGGAGANNEFLEGQRNCIRLQRATEAVALVAKGGRGSRNSFLYFVANGGGKRSLGPNQYRIGGNDFSDNPISTQ